MSVPGAVNAHTHLYSGLAALGMPAPDPPPASFVEILERVWWRLDRALDAASLRAAARLQAASALLAGTTALVDHHESPSFIEGSLDVVADACEAIGVRALVCYGATERNGGLDEARRGLAECARFLADNRRPLVRGAVGLHASFTVSDETIRDAGRLARDAGTVVHVHVAEDRVDVDDARARGFAGPLDRLLALDGLPPGSILAHGVHLSRDDVRRAEAAGLWLVQCPRSNAHNRVGYPAALSAIRRVALGTDGFAPDMLDELAALRASSRGAEVAEAAEVRLHAGRALLAERFGAIDDGVTFAAGGHVGDVTAGGRRVSDVTVGGRRVVREGRLVACDLASIHADARDIAPRLWHRMMAP